VSFAEWMQDRLHLVDYVNEALLLYPTRGEADVENLTTNGFTLRLADLRRSFGNGIYFSEEAKPVIAEATPNKETNISYFLLTRVCLGTPFITTKPLYGIASPPFAPIEQLKASKRKQKEKPEIVENETQLADSVIASLKPFRQFVVYDRSHCYPEFVVAVKASSSLKSKNVKKQAEADGEKSSRGDATSEAHNDNDREHEKGAEKSY